MGDRPAVIAVASRSFSRDARLRDELLARYPSVTWNHTGRTLKNDELIAFLRGHEKAITGLEKLDDAVFVAVPELRIVSKYGVGLDMIDLEAARRRGVSIRWTPGVNRQGVAELTIAMMIALGRNMLPLARETMDGGWRQPVGRQLSSATVGIVGCGHVGKRVAELCRAFGSTVLAHDIVSYDDFYRAHQVTPVSLERLLRESDFVTVHVPLDASTRAMIGADQIAAMKPTACVINAARGGIVDEHAIKRALIDGQLAGAAFDVYETEPPSDRELLSLPNVVPMPHIGGSTEESVLAMGRAAIEGLDDPSREIALSKY
ncbi:MAG TPA: phosphoglycerate dehydrogenase [Vicinamibacterales bacterium]|nr:phosphoglycerate dehydrogenase [Vicinamibacterales bacterium]